VGREITQNLIREERSVLNREKRGRRRALIQETTGKQKFGK
jgi:hypothetical protein